MSSGWEQQRAESCTSCLRKGMEMFWLQEKIWSYRSKKCVLGSWTETASNCTRGNESKGWSGAPGVRNETFYRGGDISTSSYLKKCYVGRTEKKGIDKEIPRDCDGLPCLPGACVCRDWVLPLNRLLTLLLTLAGAASTMLTRSVLRALETQICVPLVQWSNTNTSWFPGWVKVSSSWMGLWMKTRIGRWSGRPWKWSPWEPVVPACQPPVMGSGRQGNSWRLCWGRHPAARLSSLGMAWVWSQSGCRCGRVSKALMGIFSQDK